MGKKPEDEGSRTEEPRAKGPRAVGHRDDWPMLKGLSAKATRAKEPRA